MSIHALILGIVEGITEFLPISSTAHLMIAAKLLALDQSAFVKSFEIAIQGGAVCAVIVLYAKKLVQHPRLISKIIAGFIPTAIIGFALYSFIKHTLLGNFSVMTWSMLVGGIALIAYELWDAQRGRHAAHTGAGSPLSTSYDSAHISYFHAVLIGTAQALAVIPGVSRSAATILAGRILGLGKTAATEFSFLLALPTIVAAAGYDILKNTAVFTDDNSTTLLIGFITSFITAIIAIRLLLGFVRTYSIAWFGLYRIALAIGLFLFLF